MYSAKMGRFLQRDPAGYANTGNLYEYVGGAPTSKVDPSGLDPISYSNKWGNFIPPQLTQKADFSKIYQDVIVSAALKFQPSSICDCTEYATVQVFRLTYTSGRNKGRHEQRRQIAARLTRTTIGPLIVG